MVKYVYRQYKDAALTFKRYTLPPLFLAAPARILVEYVSPLFIAHILNAITKGTNASFKELLPWAIGFIVAPFIGELLWRTNFWFLNRGDALSMQYLSEKAFARLIEREYAFHADNFAGALVAKTNRYASAFEPLYDTLVFEVSGMLIPTVFALCIIASISWPIALILLAVLCVYVWILYILTSRRFSLTKARAAAETKQTATLADAITNSLSIKTFANAAHERKIFHRVSADLSKKRIVSWDYQNIPIDLMTTNVIIGLNGVAVIGAIYAYNYSGLSAGSLYLIITYTLQLTGKFWNFGRIIKSLETNIGNAVEMAVILEEPISITDKPDVKKIPSDLPKNAAISFEDVTFSYNEKKDAIFDNLSLQINPGERIGLVGVSGGGKTTITKLLLRFYDIQSGQIKINDTPINRMSQDDLRSLISYVPQEPALFHRSLKDNIGYAKLDASDDEILQAARVSHADEFISKLPDGYETLVGERGIKLSGGQRQRIAIARAMIKNAPILVLDEATSALDSESEVLIQDALWKLMEGRTAIVIAHRLSTIQHMDKIFVIDNGTIIEEGSHKELLSKKNGQYARLWAHQSGGFISE
ncbi:MAG: ABC transporter ATP-binding protein [Candidatus Saccharimonadales bacterium]